jgi:hypothetical protein
MAVIVRCFVEGGELGGDFEVVVRGASRRRLVSEFFDSSKCQLRAILFCVKNLVHLIHSLLNLSCARKIAFKSFALSLSEFYFHASFAL